MSVDATKNQWIPPPGRHQVGLGKSMTRFLKQRKGVQQQTKNTKPMPTSNYYQFKYNFMPESVDTTKSGMIELTTRDITTVRVERAIHQSDEVHVFRGKEEPAKEVECALIYDPTSGLYTLEKLDSTLILHHEGRGPPKVRQPSASPLPNTPSPAASTSKNENDDDLNAELFRELESVLGKRENDDDNDDDEDIPLSITSKIVASRPDSSNGKPKPILRGSGPGSTPGAKSKPPRPSPLATSLPTQSTPLPIVAQNAASPDKGKAPQVHSRTIDIEEEVLDFGKPARRTKRSHLSPQPGPPAIALPGTSSNDLALPSSSGIVSLPGPVSDQDDDDDKEEWDVVAGTGVAGTAGGEANADDDGDGSIFGDGVADAEEGEEINIDQFAAEMAAELGAEGEGDGEGEEANSDDEIFGAVEEEPRQRLRPMSLNEFAGGAIVPDDADEDYSSSSDESDDD